MNDTTWNTPLWWTLGMAESRLIARNRTVLITAAVLPLLIGFALSRSDGRLVAGGVGAVAAIQMGFVQMFGIFFAVTMTLASRRQQRYLKRLRTSPASTASIVAGLAAPSVALSLMQTLILLAFLGRQTGTLPARPELLALAFVIGAVLNVALGFLTASFTRNPEAAQVTVIPGILALMIGIGWTLMREPGEVGPVHLLVPAGAVTDLARTAWDGTGGRGFAEAVAMPGVLALAVAAAACAVAVRLFRWQPRV